MHLTKIFSYLHRIFIDYSEKYTYCNFGDLHILQTKSLLYNKTEVDDIIAVISIEWHNNLSLALLRGTQLLVLIFKQQNKVGCKKSCYAECPLLE